MDKRGDESSISNASTGSDKNILQRKSLISAANCGAQDQIKALLTDPNIDVNEQSAKGFSALHCAAGQGKIGIVRMLLNYNANPDLQTRDGFTALMLTGHSTRAWPEVADALLKAGANPNIRDMNGNTALHHASRNVHVRLVQLLCNRGADVSIRNKQGTQARGVKPWDGKRGWNLTPERWSQETKDSVRDIKNILQEAFNKQKVKKELDGNKGLDGNNGTRGIGEPPKDTKTINDLDRLVTTSTTKRMTMIGGNDNYIKIQNEDSPSLIPSRIQKVFDNDNQKSDFGQQLIAVSTQISTVSTQISHVNTTVMRLTDQQAELGRSDYHRDMKMKDIYHLAMENSSRLDQIERKLDMILSKFN